MDKKKKVFILGTFILGIAVLLGGIFILENKKIIDDDFIEDVFEGESLEKDEVIPWGPLKIGFIADVHCFADYDKKTGQWNLNWRCQNPLGFFVKKMNEVYQPDFVIEDGDFVDGKDRRSQETFVEADRIYSQLNVPRYYVLGNHETRSFTKEVWLSLVGYEKPYYYFDAKGYRIIVLDGNSKPLLGGGSIDTDPENEFYPGYIDEAQMKWLKELLEESEGYQKIVFVHQPLATEETKTQEQLFVGGKELRNLFAKNKVRAVFSGHIERFCLMQEDGVEYYVSQGFWKANGGLKKEYRFKDGGVFNEILIDNDRIEVTAFHNPNLKKQTEDGYVSLVLTPENANCSDGSAILYEEEDLESNEEETSNSEPAD